MADSAAGGEMEKCGMLGRSVACGQIVHALRSLINACVLAEKRSAGSVVSVSCEECPKA